MIDPIRSSQEAGEVQRMRPDRGDKAHLSLFQLLAGANSCRDQLWVGLLTSVGEALGPRRGLVKNRHRAGLLADDPKVVRMTADISNSTITARIDDPSILVALTLIDEFADDIVDISPDSPDLVSDWREFINSASPRFQTASPRVQTSRINYVLNRLSRAKAGPTWYDPEKKKRVPIPVSEVSLDAPRGPDSDVNLGTELVTASESPLDGDNVLPNDPASTLATADPRGDEDRSVTPDLLEVFAARFKEALAQWPLDVRAEARREAASVCYEILYDREKFGLTTDDLGRLIKQAHCTTNWTQMAALFERLRIRVSNKPIDDKTAKEIVELIRTVFESVLADDDGGDDV